MPSDKEVLKKTFRKNESVVSRTIADEKLLVPVRGDLADMQRIFSLNPVAEHIWEHLDGKQNLEDIRDTVLDSFDVGKDQVEADMSEFIEELLEAGLILEAE